jgi:hypothetical protein
MRRDGLAGRGRLLPASSEGLLLPVRCRLLRRGLLRQGGGSREPPAAGRHTPSLGGGAGVPLWVHLLQRLLHRLAGELLLRGLGREPLGRLLVLQWRRLEGCLLQRLLGLRRRKCCLLQRRRLKRCLLLLLVLLWWRRRKGLLLQRRYVCCLLLLLRRRQWRGHKRSLRLCYNLQRSSLLLHGGVRYARRRVQPRH